VPLVLIILLGSWVIAGLVAALGMATGDFCQVNYTTLLLCYFIVYDCTLYGHACVGSSHVVVIA
jgi:hypothetical protein